jgi:hypothetical protein
LVRLEPDELHEGEQREHEGAGHRADRHRGHRRAADVPALLQVRGERMRLEPATEDRVDHRTHEGKKSDEPERDVR